MNDVNKNDRLKFQSEVYDNESGPNNVKLDFLVSPSLGLKAPVLERLQFVFTFQVDTGAGGADERDFYALITQILLRDATGERINLSGASWQIVQQLESPPNTTPPFTPITGAQNNQVRTLVAYLDFRPKFARARNDFALPLREFAQVGRMSVTLNTAGNGVATRITNVDSASFYVVAEVADDIEPEMKSRLCYADFAIGKADDWYPVDGSLRWAVAHNGAVGQITGPWASQNVTSKGLELNDFPSISLINLAQRERGLQLNFVTAGGVTILSHDPLLDGTVIPILFPTTDEKLTRLPDVKSVHYKTDGTITTADEPMFIACYIGERSANAAAATFGMKSGQALEQEVERRGVIVGSDGKRKRAVGGGWDGRLIGRMPIKLRKSVG